MKARIFSTIALWLAIIISLYAFGAPAGVWLIVLLSGLSQHEFYRLLERLEMKPAQSIGITLGSLSLLGGWYLPWKPGFDASSAALGLATLILGLSLLAKPRREHLVGVVAPTLLGMMFVPFMLQFFIRLLHYFESQGEATQGLMLGVWIIAAAKFADVGGLLLGKRFGRNKLAPHISPGKTWEGVAGGLLVSAGVSFALVLFFRSSFPDNFAPWMAALLALPIALTGVASDLLESVLKRLAQVKDSGNIIPGIGGALDLTDSLLLSAPLGYCLILLVL